MKCTTEMKNARAKAAKLLFFICQIFKFMTFLSPSSSCLVPYWHRDDKLEGEDGDWGLEFAADALGSSRNAPPHEQLLTRALRSFQEPFSLGAPHKIALER